MIPTPGFNAAFIDSKNAGWNKTSAGPTGSEESHIITYTIVDNIYIYIMYNIYNIILNANNCMKIYK